MKRLLLAATAAIAIVGTASAADIGYRRPPPPVAPVVPAVLPFSWTSCYLGGFLGGAWASDIVVNNGYAQVLGVPFDSWSYSLDNSFIGGGTAGCNWQPIGSPLVVGIEGEIGYVDLSGSAYDPRFPLGSNVLTASASIGNTYGMITGRLGYAVDRVLFYVKGGVAFVDESVTVTHPAFPNLGIPAVAVTATNDDARWTIGAGVEWAFANNWSLKGEYMYIGTDNGSPCGFVLGGPVIPAGNYCWNHSGPDGISTAKVGLNYRFNGLFGGVAAFVGPY
jgi:outer membrane immunogenic protein